MIRQAFRDRTGRADKRKAVIDKTKKYKAQRRANAILKLRFRVPLKGLTTQGDETLMITV